MEHIIAHPTDIHPEIPLAPWVTRRYEDDNGRLVVDEDNYVYDVGIEVSRNVVHVLNEDGSHRSSPESALISYDVKWPNEGVDHEQITVVRGLIPALIAVLLRLEKEMAQ